jgi:hypothetical protein
MKETVEGGSQDELVGISSYPLIRREIGGETAYLFDRRNPGEVNGSAVELGDWRELDHEQIGTPFGNLTQRVRMRQMSKRSVKPIRN